MSASIRSLYTDEQQELDDWLIPKQIVLNNRTRRNLSDVVNMADLFRGIVPKLVNMKNYTSHGNLLAKILNWEIFNLNVLRKTGLKLKRPALERLASGDLISIRALLFHLMRLERDGMPLSSRNQSSAKARSQPDSIEFQQGDSMNNLPNEQNEAQESDEIMKAKYNELKIVNETKAEFINLLNSKVQYLESVIIDKEKRISELLSHLSMLTVRIMSMHSTRQSEELTLEELGSDRQSTNEEYSNDH